MSLSPMRRGYRRAPWALPRQIEDGIGGPEWGTFLGPKHVERVSLERLSASAAFTQVRPLKHGGVYLQLSQDAADAQSPAIDDLVAAGRAALDGIAFDVSELAV